MNTLKGAIGTLNRIAHDHIWCNADSYRYHQVGRTRVVDAQLIDQFEQHFLVKVVHFKFRFTLTGAIYTPYLIQCWLISLSSSVSISLTAHCHCSSTLLLSTWPILISTIKLDQFSFFLSFTFNFSFVQLQPNRSRHHRLNRTRIWPPSSSCIFVLVVVVIILMICN